MDDAVTQVRVNFGKPFPIFPLDGVVLLPHAMLRLYIFEPRYRQMIEHVLDGSGQIAMGVFEGEAWRESYQENPPIRPAVCVGQIVEHARQHDGTYHVWLQGICRAIVREEHLPEGSRLYREALLEPGEKSLSEEGPDATHAEGPGPEFGAGDWESPAEQELADLGLEDPTDDAGGHHPSGFGGSGHPDDVAPTEGDAASAGGGGDDAGDELALAGHRDRLLAMLSEPPIGELGAVKRMFEQIDSQVDDRGSIPTEVFIELISLSVVGGLGESEVMYRLLAEGDARRRAEVVMSELGRLRELLERAGRQYDPEAPTGVSWN